MTFFFVLQPHKAQIKRVLFASALLALLLSTIAEASQNLLFHNTANGKMAYWSLETTGLLKNRSQGDGWDLVSTWAPATAWRAAIVQTNADAQSSNHVIWRNTSNGKLMYWALGSDGKLRNRTKDEGWGFISEDKTAPLPWRLIGIQYNADKIGGQHLILFNPDNGKTAYWKLDSTGKLKNTTRGDGWNLISSDWTQPSPWTMIGVQANADRAGGDHLIWHNTSNGRTRYWKLDSTGVLKNRTKGDGWNNLSTWELPTNWRVVGLQANADKQGGDHLLFQNKVTGKTVFWKLDSTGLLKNRTQGDGWDFISDTKAPAPWTFVSIETNADGQNGDNLLWRNTANGKVLYWKLASTGRIKNITRDDGWGLVSDWQISPSWRAVGLDP